MLSDKVHKKGLQVVHRARIPSGKRVPLRPAPKSIFAAEPYAPPSDFTSTLGKSASGGKRRGKEFVTSIHAQEFATGRDRFVHRRQPPKLSPIERRGPKWGKQ